MNDQQKHLHRLREIARSINTECDRIAQAEKTTDAEFNPDSTTVLGGRPSKGKSVGGINRDLWTRHHEILTELDNLRREIVDGLIRLQKDSSLILSEICKINQAVFDLPAPISSASNPAPDSSSPSDTENGSDIEPGYDAEHAEPADIDQLRDQIAEGAGYGSDHIDIRAYLQGVIDRLDQTRHTSDPFRTLDHIDHAREDLRRLQTALDTENEGDPQ